MKQYIEYKIGDRTYQTFVNDVSIYSSLLVSDLLERNGIYVTGWGWMSNIKKSKLQSINDVITEGKINEGR